MEQNNTLKTQVNPNNNNMKMNFLHVSVVIPTRNRSFDIQKLLESLKAQSIPPKEILVIDDSSDKATLDVCDSYAGSFKNLRWLRGEQGGICAARNQGTRHSTCDIVLYVDDDVILSPNYIAELLRVYNLKPEAKGVAGYLLSPNKKRSLSSLSENINKAFKSYMFLDKDSCRVLASGGLTYPIHDDKIFECEWLSGTNCSYKLEVMRQFHWDEKLLSYSLYDDVDLSVQVRNAYPYSLFITPYAFAYHYPSSSGRVNLAAEAYIRTAYPLYFFHKHFSGSLHNRFDFLIGQLGRSVLMLLSYKKPSYFWMLITAYQQIIRDRYDIYKGNFSIP